MDDSTAKRLLCHSPQGNKTTEFFEFFSRVFSVNSPGTARQGKCVAELVFAVVSWIQIQFSLVKEPNRKCSKFQILNGHSSQLV